MTWIQPISSFHCCVYLFFYILCLSLFHFLSVFVFFLCVFLFLYVCLSIYLVFMSFSFCLVCMSIWPLYLFLLLSKQLKMIKSVEWFLFSFFFLFFFLFFFFFFLFLSFSFFLFFLFLFWVLRSIEHQNLHSIQKLGGESICEFTSVVCCFNKTMPSGLRSGDSVVVLTTEQVWSILSDYISYLSQHNQTASGKPCTIFLMFEWFILTWLWLNEFIQCFHFYKYNYLRKHRIRKC